MHALVSRGPNKGVTLRPHRHTDGCYVASRSRFARAYVRVKTEAELSRLKEAGLSVRMSAPGLAPSLICPDSIRL